MSWFLVALIGFFIGALVGLISGIMIADDWWRKKSKYYDRLYSNSPKDADLLYEIEKREDKHV